eukprot:EC718997.1.p1 GENE.EC718997.1~~EC718997.1.p1  ORF type:complete len:69 (+),score=6.06 EC718997.1:174-380(+)
MQTFSGVSTTPPLYTYTKKLTNARRRLFAVNTTLSTELERRQRLDNAHLPRQIAASGDVVAATSAQRQ